MKLYARQLLALGLVVQYLAAATEAEAQAPKSADPSKIEERFEPQIEPRLPADTSPVVPERRPAVKIKGAESRHFVLKEVRVDGATVYTLESLKPLFADSLGKEISVADAQNLAEKITAKYRSAGYVLTQAIVPADQPFTDGVLRIRVAEGFVNNVVIQGEVKQNSWRDLLGAYGDKIKRQKPLNISTLERYLLLMDDLPGATVKGVLRPSASTFGAADLVVTVSHKTYEGSLSFDNRGSRYVGPYQISGTVAGNSVLGLYERTLLRAITVTQVNELQFFDLQHEEQIGHEGTRLLVSGSYSKTDPGYLAKPLDVDGESYSFQVKTQHPFIRSRAENLVGRALLDYRNTDTDVLDADSTNDRVRTLRVGGEYDFADRFQGVNLFDVQVSQGLDIFNATDSSSPTTTRPGANAHFTKVNADITRTQALPKGFSLLTAVTGQFAGSKLVTSEQFSVGGAGFGGAYDPAEISGDHGVAAKAELRYGHAPGYSYLNSYQAFAYYDIGGVWNKDGTSGNHTLASTGLGIRTNFTPWLSGSGEVGFPLTKPVAIENDKDPRFFFSLTGRF